MDGWIFLLALNPKVDTLLFPTNADPLQLCHSPRAKILVFKLQTSSFETKEI